LLKECAKLLMEEDLSYRIRWALLWVYRCAHMLLRCACRSASPACCALLVQCTVDPTTLPPFFRGPFWRLSFAGMSCSLLALRCTSSSRKLRSGTEQNFLKGDAQHKGQGLQVMAAELV
jgi:hypothetical protein